MITSDAASSSSDLYKVGHHRQFNGCSIGPVCPAPQDIVDFSYMLKRIASTDSTVYVTRD